MSEILGMLLAWLHFCHPSNSVKALKGKRKWWLAISDLSECLSLYEEMFWNDLGIMTLSIWDHVTSSVMW